MGMQDKTHISSDGPVVGLGPNSVILDEDNNVLDLATNVGKVGRLGRGGSVPVGYYKDEKKSAETFLVVDGMRISVPGDFARIEEEGKVTLLGRGSNCINTGGEKVYPEEVEGALKSHPDVFDALVIGVPDERLGQRVAAVVQLREGAEPDLAAIEEHVRGEIAGYKVPRTIWLTGEIGRSPSGKPDYPWAQRYAAEHEPATAQPV
jgi:acyl-CoA synthetase (AMP-forming)/AMP-acid ligase II